MTVVKIIVRVSWSVDQWCRQGGQSWCWEEHVSNLPWQTGWSVLMLRRACPTSTLTDRVVGLDVEQSMSHIYPDRQSGQSWCWAEHVPNPPWQIGWSVLMLSRACPTSTLTDRVVSLDVEQSMSHIYPDRQSGRSWCWAEHVPHLPWQTEWSVLILSRTCPTSTLTDRVVSLDVEQNMSHIYPDRHRMMGRFGLMIKTSDSFIMRILFKLYLFVYLV